MDAPINQSAIIGPGIHISLARHNVETSDIDGIANGLLLPTHPRCSQLLEEMRG